MALTRQIVALSIAVGLSSGAHALRCGSSLVHTNDTQEDVMEKCGPPAHQHGHKWYYGDGSSYRVHEVLFVDRKVWRIRIVNPGT